MDYDPDVHHEKMVKTFLNEVDVKNKTIREIYQIYQRWYYDNCIGHSLDFRFFKEVYEEKDF